MAKTLLDMGDFACWVGMFFPPTAPVCAGIAGANVVYDTKRAINIGGEVSGAVDSMIAEQGGAACDNVSSIIDQKVEEVEDKITSRVKSKVVKTVFHNKKFQIIIGIIIFGFIAWIILTATGVFDWVQKNIYDNTIGKIPYPFNWIPPIPIFRVQWWALKSAMPWIFGFFILLCGGLYLYLGHTVSGWVDKYQGIKDIIKTEINNRCASGVSFAQQQASNVGNYAQYQLNQYAPTPNPYQQGQDAKKQAQTYYQQGQTVVQGYARQASQQEQQARQRLQGYSQRAKSFSKPSYSRR